MVGLGVWGGAGRAQGMSEKRWTSTVQQEGIRMGPERGRVWQGLGWAGQGGGHL